MQIILVDDGSTDCSNIICDKYASKDNRIIVIHQENRGLVAARKAGLQHAVGDYIGFVDGDDYVEPTMYETLLQEIINSQADVVHAGFWNGNQKELKFTRQVIDLEKNRNRLLEDILETGEITPSIWSKLFKGELIRESYAKVKDTSSYGEDLICLCEVIMKAKKISLLDQAEYHYCIRQDSISHVISVDNVKKEIKLHDDICEILRENRCYEQFETVMNRFLINHILMGLEKINDNEFQVQKYYFPKPEFLQNKRIIIYGAGRIGRDYYSQICRYNNCEVVAWVDKYPEKCHYKYIQVRTIEELLGKEYDFIVIAVKSEIMVANIREELKVMGIEADKVLWETPRLLIETSYI